MRHNKKMIFAVMILAGGILLVFAFFYAKSQSRAEVTIGNATFYAEVADTGLLRAKGLMGRTRLNDDEGMIFIFDNLGAHSFWMKGMKIPIDIVWIRGDRVAGILENLFPDKNFLPRLYYPPEPVNRVLEIKAGLAARYNIKTGDEVIIRK